MSYSQQKLSLNMKKKSLDTLLEIELNKKCDDRLDRKMEDSHNDKKQYIK